MANAGRATMTKRKDSELAKTIRELRAKLGLTQEKFAATLGVTWSTVNRWENGRGSPSPLAVRRIEELASEADDEAEDMGPKPSRTRRRTCHEYKDEGVCDIGRCCRGHLCADLGRKSEIR